LPIGRSDEGWHTAHKAPCPRHARQDEQEHTAKPQGRKAPGGRRRHALRAGLVGPLRPRQQESQQGEAAQPDTGCHEVDHIKADLH